jgi:uncharacterized protein (TIGR02118 family)
MIKVTVMYANAPGARFDHEYYRNRHMPLVKERMGASCRYYTIDRGVAGASAASAGTQRGRRLSGHILEQKQA